MRSPASKLRFSDPDGPVVKEWNAQAQAHLNLLRRIARPHVVGMHGGGRNRHSVYPAPPKLRLASSADKDL